MNQLSYYVTKRLIVGSKDSSGTIIHSWLIQQQSIRFHQIKPNSLIELNFFNSFNSFVCLIESLRIRLIVGMKPAASKLSLN